MPNESPIAKHNGLRPRKKVNVHSRIIAVVIAGVVSAAVLSPQSRAATCKSQAQMTAAQRNAIVGAAREIATQVQSGNVQALRENTIPAVAANFGGIAASAAYLRPLLQNAAITVDDLYWLDAANETAGVAQTSFYCGTRIVVLNFNNLPAGVYAFAIVHATGVPKPQQLALVLSQTQPGRWMLAGFFNRPMTENGHDGLWYWEQARQYSAKNMKLAAWFYYQTAATLLRPVQFLSSPNFGKLQHEAEQSRPANLPGAEPLLLNVNGATFKVTSMGTTTTFGGFDLEVHYEPDPTQITQLRDPVAARKQAIAIMEALAAANPGLREAFHGIWVRADVGNASIYALELPMDQIPGSSSQTASMANPAAQ